MRDAKLRLVVKSTRVARVVEFESPVMTVYGKVGTTRRRAAVYDYVLDERQKSLVSEARELAARSGVVLEVTDVTRQNVVRRALASGLTMLAVRGSRSGRRMTIREAGPGPVRTQASAA